MSKEKIEVWITKYALTRGILHLNYAINCEEANGENKGMIAVQGLGYIHNHKFRKSWFLNEEEAMSEARRMKDAKLESLRKQMAKMEKKEIKIKHL